MWYIFHWIPSNRFLNILSKLLFGIKQHIAEGAGIHHHITYGIGRRPIGYLGIGAIFMLTGI